MRIARLVLAASFLLVLGSCAGDDSASGAYALTEWSIDGPAVLSNGPQSLDVTNTGEFPHTLVITDVNGTVVAATELVQPGESVGLDIDLGDGQYSFTCRIVAQNGEGELVDHFEEGMEQIITVGG